MPEELAGIRIVHVPYKGAAGQLDAVVIDSIATDHSSNNSECVPARTKMMALPSRR